MILLDIRSFMAGTRFCSQLNNTSKVNIANTNSRILWLEEQLRNSLSETTNEFVSSHAFYSYRHANRLFVSLKGESIHSYVIKLRIQAATEYLIYTSRSIKEIANEVGYESTAAFSKAFKKLIKQSPSAYRQANKVRVLLPSPRTQKKYYTIQYIDDIELLIKKVPLSLDITAHSFFNAVKSSFDQLESNAANLLLLWDEDPELTQVAESRFFLGIDSNEIGDQMHFSSKTFIKGRYAIFKASAFQNQPYKNWHHLAYLILDLDGKTLRKDLYIEWFSTKALDSIDSFHPEKIAVPIL